MPKGAEIVNREETSGDLRIRTQQGPNSNRFRVLERESNGVVWGLLPLEFSHQFSSSKCRHLLPTKGFEAHIQSHGMYKWQLTGSRFDERGGRGTHVPKMDIPWGGRGNEEISPR